MNVKKQIAKKMQGSKVSKNQLRTESISFLKKLAHKEEQGNELQKKFGSFGDRLNNLAKVRK